MKNVVLAGLVLGLSAVPTLAADVVEDIPAVEAPAPFVWTGFYIGAQLGGGWSRVDQPYGNIGGPIIFSQDNSDGSGVVGGVHVGYNHQVGAFVLGAEADIDATGIDGDDGGSGGDINGFEVDWMGSVRARAGYAMDRTLIYATGGYAFMRGTAYVADPGEEEEVDGTFHGWTVGAGVEHAFTDNITARLEYRYTDFGAKELTFDNNGYVEDIDPSFHTVKVGISYKF